MSNIISWWSWCMFLGEVSTIFFIQLTLCGRWKLKKQRSKHPRINSKHETSNYSRNYNNNAWRTQNLQKASWKIMRLKHLSEHQTNRENEWWYPLQDFKRWYTKNPRSLSGTPGVSPRLRKGFLQQPAIKPSTNSTDWKEVRPCIPAIYFDPRFIYVQISYINLS